MRVLCRISQRWHPEFGAAANLQGHPKLRQCPPQVQAIRPYRQVVRGRRVAPLYKSRTELHVREYDQLGDEIASRTRIDPKAELEKETALVKGKIDKLDEELGILRQGPFGPDSEFMQSLPPDERGEMLKSLEKDGLLQGFDPDLAELERLEHEMNDEDSMQELAEEGHVPKVTLRIPKQQKAYVQCFNKAVEAVVAETAGSKQDLILWKWYLRCQQHVPNFSSILPEDTWQILWDSQGDSKFQSKHLAMLGRDMLSAGIDLTGEQIVMYINCLQRSEDLAAAVATWEKHKTSLGSNVDLASSFWEAGIRIYASLGRPQKAQDLAFELLEHESLVNPQILLPVISSWADSKNSAAPQKLWTCYLKLRQTLKEEMSPAVYEDISNILLKSNRSDMALAVFKDMVVSKENSSSDSKAVYEKALDYVKGLQSTAVTEEHVNRISLTALLVLPKAFQNKYFFGSWIKNLIGRGEIDAAATVVELMYERGVPLDARHLNGIVGAWLRDGSPTAKAKAERLAWSMIHARVAFVRERDAKAAQSLQDCGQGGRRNPYTSLDRIPHFLRRAAPQANIETFSTLLLYYTRRSDIPVAEHLTQIMTGPAQIAPNSFIMNHWLYAALRSSDIQGVWDKYSALKSDIRPDLETFAALWDTAKVQYDQARSAHAKNFPSARQLFAEMTTWLESLSERDLKRAKDNFERELYDQILRCFCISSDLQGALCAVYGMKNVFGEFPNENAIRMLTVQISRLLPPPDGVNEMKAVRMPRKQGRSRSTAAQRRDGMAKVVGIVENIVNEHAARLIKQGINPDDGLDANSEQANQMQLDVLTEFLLFFIDSRKKAGGSVPNEVKTVAKVMQVDASEVDFGCITAGTA